MRELPFVGDDRRALVDRLMAVFGEVSQQGSPRLVTLEAASGWGKSRVVQEFYRQLAADQPEPRYWPASILEATPLHAVEGQGPTERRKRVYPEVFAAAEGSVPHWLWWGISATARKTGSVVDALAGDLRQIEVHTSALEARWRQVSGRKERLGQLLKREEARSLGAMATEEMVGSGLEKLLEASVPGLGLLWWAGRLTWEHRERWSAGRRAAGEIDVAAAGREDLVAGLASSLGHFAAAGIPIVIVVEDVHEADASLVELLVRTLVQRRGPIMVVATGWPGFLDDEDRSAHRLMAEVPVPACTRLRGGSLQDLDLADRGVLVGRLLPDAPVMAQEALARRYPNPFLLELVCQSPRVVELLEDGELTDDEVARLPEDAEGVYRDMWRVLPEQLREALMLAVLGAPSTIGDLFSSSIWDAELTANAWRALPRVQEQAERLRGLLTESGDAYAWVRSVDEWLQACHEPVQHQVALAHAGERHSDGRRRRYYQALADSVDLDDPGLSPPRRRAQAQLLTALAAEGFIGWTTPVVAAGDRLLEEAAEGHDVDGLRTVIALGKAIPDTDDGTARWRRHLVATALGKTGQLQEAIELFTGLLADHQRLLGGDHPDTLTTRNNLASSLGEAGRTGEAIELFTGLLVDQQRVLGDAHPGTLTTRGNLASWLGEAGRTGEAIDRLTGLLDDHQRLLGGDHPDTLRTRNNLASSLAESGRVGEAIEQLTGLLADRQRLLGGDHPDTLTTRNNLAFWLGDAGQPQEAIEQLTGLLADRQRLLGGDHPDTLTTRNNLAFWLAESGRVGEAIEQFAGLLADQQRLLGDDHPDTLITRNNLAALLGRSGQTGEAIEQLTGLLADRQRLLGDDHPDTLITRSNLAFWLGKAGQLPEAIDQFRRLLADQQRVSGDVAPDTLITRNNLASLLGRSGRTGEAIEQFAGLLADRQRLLGDDHPDTLITRSNLAFWLAESGRVGEAIDQFRRLLADQQRLLGGDHPDTLRTRNYLAFMLGQAGQTDEAIGQARALLEDCRRVLGLEHPLTVAVSQLLERLLDRGGRESGEDA